MEDYFKNKVAVITGTAVGALGDIKEDNLKKKAERLNAPYPDKVHPLPPMSRSRSRSNHWRGLPVSSRTASTSSSTTPRSG